MISDFSLIDQPWIKVLNFDNEEELVSLRELFKNSKNFRKLAGEMYPQDLAILRLLVAITTTVYTRYDANGKLYDWIDENSGEIVDMDVDDLDSDELEDVTKAFLETWHGLYENQSFTSSVIEYLDENKANFNFFGDKPFYQVSREVYDSFVDKSKVIGTGKGVVAIKQINRRISESNNSPAIFSPKTDKNSIALDELIRWVITYQNYTGTTDKSKIGKYSVSSGWLYNLDPVFIKGKNLFETILFNTVLILDGQEERFPQIIQKPIWERDSKEYIESLLDDMVPDNIAELYTNQSRMLHVAFENGGYQIYSTGLPGLENENYFLEPMTTWRSKKADVSVPNLKRLDKYNEKMWRNIGLYVNTKKDTEDRNYIPGVISWVEKLIDAGFIEDSVVTIQRAGFVKDGNASSQLPAAEFYDVLSFKAGILRVNQDEWITNIIDTVKLTKEVVGIYYYYLQDVEKKRKSSSDQVVAKEIALVYDKLNYPFQKWLLEITPESEKNVKLREWKDELLKIMTETIREYVAGINVVQMKTSKKDDNDKNGMNFFSRTSMLSRMIYSKLK